MKDARGEGITVGAWVAVMPSNGIKETETGEVMEIREESDLLVLHVYWAYHERSNPRQIRYRLHTKASLVLVLK